MQSIHKIFLIALLPIFMTACSNESKKSGEDLTENLEDVISDVQKNNTSASSEGKALVKKYSTALDQLLTLELAAEVTGYAATEAKKDYNTIFKDPSTHSIQYTWEKGRSGKIRGFNGDFPKSDAVSLSWFRATSLEDFKHNYHTPTQEELKKMDEALNENTSNTKEGNTAKSMAQGFADGLSFDEIPGVGEYAVWNNKFKELMVYDKGIQFQLYVEVSNDTEINRSKAIELAKKIIETKLN